MRTYEPITREAALQQLAQWFKDAPGGRYLPGNVLDLDPTEVVVTGGGSDRLLWRLFTAAYDPTEPENDDGETTYVVPRIVAEALVWYGGDDEWWAEFDGPAPTITGPEPPTYFEMYSDDGEQACQAACRDILAAITGNPAVTNRATLADMARPIIHAVAALHPEVGDTEPRGHFGDFLDAICAARGWSFDPSEGYDL